MTFNGLRRSECVENPLLSLIKVAAVMTVLVALSLAQSFAKPAHALSSPSWYVDHNFAGSSTHLNSVACPDESMCIAVGTGPNSIMYESTDKGSNWEDISSQLPTAVSSLSSVSCITTSYCQAVGANSAALVFNGSTWVQETLPPPKSADHLSLISSGVACVSTSFCQVAGAGAILFEGTTDVQINMIGLVGSTWVQEAVPPIASDLVSISCVTSSFCQSFSYQSFGSFPLSLFSGGTGIAFNGESWSQSMNLTSGVVSSVSCMSSSFCQAVGSTEEFIGSTSPAIVSFPTIWNFDGTNWSGPTELSYSGALNSVSCVSTTFCMAVGNKDTTIYPWGGVATQGLALAFDGTNWSQTNLPQIVNSLSSVSCIASTYCQAVGTYSIPTPNGNINQVAALGWNGSTWTTESLPISYVSNLTSISCVTISYCQAVGSNNSTAVVYDGTYWNSEEPLPSNTLNLNSISCVTISYCQAVGSDNSAIVYDGTTWIQEATPVSSLSSVDCVSVGVCFAVGGGTVLTLSSLPTVNSISPAVGPLSGNTPVVISGSNFEFDSKVSFGTAPAADVVVVSSTQIDVYSPPSAYAVTANITVTNLAGTSATSSADQFGYQSASSPPTVGVYFPLSPVRVADTRPNSGYQLQGNKFGPSVIQNVTVTGLDSVPTTATTVVANVTVTNTTSDGGYLTLWPTGQSQPETSNLNFSAGQSVANLVTINVGSNGQISIFNYSGQSDVIIDVEGYYGPVASNGGLYNPLVPARLADSRPGNIYQLSGSTFTSGQTQQISVLGAGGVPSSGVSSVILNVTATNTTGSGDYVSVFPGGTAPNSSNLNFSAGQSVSNRVIVPVSALGNVSISFFSVTAGATADIIVDVNGYFSNSPLSSGYIFHPVTLTRVCDTRNVGNNECTNKSLSSNSVLNVMIANNASNDTLPSMSSVTPVVGLVANVTVTDVSANGGYLTIFPSGQVQPSTSDLNWNSGPTLANAAILEVGPDGSVNVYNYVGSADVIIDISGWFG